MAGRGPHLSPPALPGTEGQDGTQEEETVIAMQHGTACPRQERMADACVKTRKRILKGKEKKEKTHQRNQEDNLLFSCILEDDGIS